MKVIHVLCLSALISTAPGLLAGCGGGSSNSGNSAQVTQANVTFTSSVSGLDTSAFRLKGVAANDLYAKGIRVTYNSVEPNEGNLVGTLALRSSIPLSGDLRRSIDVVLHTANPTDQPIGKVYSLPDYLVDSNYGQEGTARITYQNALVRDIFVSIGGSIEVVAKNGDSVTLRLNNASFRRSVLGSEDTIVANGTFTYKQSNIDITSPTSISKKSAN